MEILSGPSGTALRAANIAVPRGAAGPGARPHPGHRLTCQTVTTTTEFYRLEAAWTKLTAVCRRPSAFATWDFAVEWWRHFVLGQVGRATGRFQVIVVRDEDESVVGIVPLYEERTKGAAGIGLRLQPFGRSYSFEPMSDEPIALFHRQREGAALDAVRRYLTEHAREGAWDMAVIRGSGQGDDGGRVRLKRHTAEVVRAAEAAMLVRLPQRWDLFRKGLSKSMRDNLSYYPKRLDREVGAWAIRAARTVPEVALATEALIALHHERSRSRVGKPHCNHIPTPTHAAFMRGWFLRLARRGAITLMVFETAAGIRAAQAFLEHAGGADVYYSGHGEDVYRFSALTLITAAWLRLSIERGLGKVRFPPASASWSLRWGAAPAAAVDETSIYAMSGRTVLRAIARRCHLSLHGG
jgi:hypothetical protein